MFEGYRISTDGIRSSFKLRKHEICWAKACRCRRTLENRLGGRLSNIADVETEIGKNWLGSERTKDIIIGKND